MIDERLKKYSAETLDEKKNAIKEIQTTQKAEVARQSE